MYTQTNVQAVIMFLMTLHVYCYLFNVSVFTNEYPPSQLMSSCVLKMCSIVE